MKILKESGCDPINDPACFKLFRNFTLKQFEENAIEQIPVRGVNRLPRIVANPLGFELSSDKKFLIITVDKSIINDDKEIPEEYKTIPGFLSLLFPGDFIDRIEYKGSYSNESNPEDAFDFFTDYKTSLDFKRIYIPVSFLEKYYIPFTSIELVI